MIRRPTASEPANATFFFRDHSGMAGEFPFLEFPFVPELLAPKGVVLPIKPEPLRAEPVPEPPAEVEEPHEPRRTFAPEPGEPASPGRKGKLKPVLFALPVVLLGLASYPAFHLLPRGRVATPAPPPIAVPEPPAAATGLGLFAERQNSDLKLTWNRDSPMVKAAASGVLSIRDGSSQRDLALDGAQVRGGSLLYSPVSSQVQLQLAITGPGGHAAESVIAILPKHIPDGAAEPRRAASAAAPASLKPFVAPQRRPEAFDAPPSIGPPPIGKPALVPAGLTASFLNPELHPPAPVPATPTARKETAARPPVRVAAWRPPALIRESAPAIPPALRPLLGSQKSVEVRVDLDAAGRVLSAQSVREPYLHKLLADSAEAAARRCTFEPAHNGDKAVPSEIILRFQFKAQP